MSIAISLPRNLPEVRLLAATWRALTSVRVASSVILLLAVVSLVGVLVPQAPIAVRNDLGLQASWLSDQRAMFGSATPFMNHAGLFNVFNTWWFYSLLAWVVVSIGACTVNRTQSIMRQAFRPPHRVPDGLFDRRSAVQMPGSLTAEKLGARLRRRWFRVWREEDGGNTYVFADRFGWAALGTFATHIGLVLFLVGALVSRFDGFSAAIAVAEGQSAPVFPLEDERHLVVGVDRAVGAFDTAGRALDFRSDLYIVQNGVTVKRCTITVNDPCSFGEYRFHQAAFFGFGAELLVRDAKTGGMIYRETLALGDSLPAPRITVTDSFGRTVFEGVVPLLDVIGGKDGTVEVFGADGHPYWLELGAAGGEWLLTVFDASSNGVATSAAMSLGQSADIGGMVFTFESVGEVPMLVTTGVPLPGVGAVEAAQSEILVALENAEFGTVVGGSDSAPSLRISGISQMALRLEIDQPVTVGEYDYEFVAQRNFVGVAVRKDRGDTLIWIAGGLFLAGLVTTLWFPRSRAWFRFDADGNGRMHSTGRWKIDESDILD